MRTPVIWLLVVALGLGLGMVFAISQYALEDSFDTPKEGDDKAAGDDWPALPPIDGPQPSLVVDDGMVYDFGQMEFNSSGSHSFVVRNVGDFPLELKLHDTSCKCTVGGLSANRIPPGKSGEVTLEWTAESQSPSFRQRATLRTNDREWRIFELTIVGKIIESLVVDPPSITFSKPREEERTFQVNVLAPHHTDLKIEDHVFSRPESAAGLDVTYERMSPEELGDHDALSGWSVRVVASDELPIGVLDQVVILKTNLDEKPRFTIPLRGKVRGDITVTGRVWNERDGVWAIGRVDPKRGAVARGNIMIRGQHRQDVAFELVEATPDFVDVELGSPTEIGSVVQIPLRCEIPQGTGPANHLGEDQGPYGEIVLKTGHPEMEHLRLKLQFVVVGG